jgi:predicted N-acetyltransferase YhbS
MNLIFDREKENEFAEIYELIKVAFQTSENADGDEQDYVNNLRISKNYIPELALTVKDNNKIIGHIMLTKTSIIRNNEIIEALLLSPVCTLYEYRNKGVASKLIRHSMTLARKKDYKAIFLVGEPEYYSRFGFKSITNFGINDTGDIPEKYTMGLELEDGFLGTKGGTISIC